jgi:gamma-glutamyltranspeptidase/glutathione hydrolase
MGDFPYLIRLARTDLSKFCSRVGSRASTAARALSLTFVFAAAWPAANASDGPAFARYAVAADHPEASAAGAALLAQGGNAADAAAATMLALGVVSPASSGLGGGGFALYYRARDKTLTVLDFRERAPLRTTPDVFRAREGDTAEVTKQRSQRGGLAVGVPGEPLGIAELLRRFGKKPLSSVVKPAERLAREGFGLSEHARRMLAFVGDALAKDALFAGMFGKPPAAGEKTKNQALARTLARFGREGANLFYRGALASEMVKAVQAAGGSLSARDLAQYRVREREALRATRLGYEWATMGPPSAGGYTILTSLAFLERTLSADALAHAGSVRGHALIESWKGPYLDRQRYFGDPDFVDVRLAELTADARVEARTKRFDANKASSVLSYDLPLPGSAQAQKPADDHGTSHLCVVDAEGNIAAVTTTVNLLFGAGISVGGFWLNNEMDDFAREVGKENAFGLIGGAPNLPGPLKRPVSSMSPLIVFQDGQPVLCAGGSGGSRIPTAVEQVALLVLKDGLHPTAAAAAPRLHHQADPDRVDGRDLPEAWTKELSARGHKLHVATFAAHVQAIRIGAPGPERLRAGSDPHKGGEPRGE